MPKIATVNVPLKGGRAYPIEIGSGTLSGAGGAVRERFGDAQVYAIADRTVARLHLPAVARSLDRARLEWRSFILPPGERNKNFDNYRKAIEKIPAFAGKKTLVVLALGGGVVGDLAGFVAATWRRGTPYVQLPTTLLADVDSSVGGKTAVDLPQAKNMVGAFHQPSFVLIDVAALKTLPLRQLRAGLAEVIKYGVVFDAGLFGFIEENLDALLALKVGPTARIVQRSCEWKAGVVAKDEFDRTGRRALLNFGHTFGHAIETATTYGKYLHGEAVAVGMICAADLSERLGLAKDGTRARMETLLKRAGLPTTLRGANLDGVMSAMNLDKKFGAGKTRFVLCERIGRARLVENPDPALVVDVLKARMGL